jgi:hypothetical protein
LKIAVGSTALCLLLDVVKLTYLAPPKQYLLGKDLAYEHFFTEKHGFQSMKKYGL